MTDTWRSLQAQVAGPGRLMAAGSGPRLLRMGLRHDTGAVRGFPSALEVLARAGTMLPPEMFGGALLDVLGDRLRGALTTPTAGRPPGQGRPATPWPEITGEPASTVIEAVPSPLPPAVAVALAETPTGATDSVDRIDAAAPRLSRSGEQLVMGEASARAHNGAMVTSLLVRRLAAYWRSADRADQRDPMSSSWPTAALAPAGGRGSAWDTLGTPARSGSSWPGRDDAAVVGRPLPVDDGRIAGPDDVPWLDLDGATRHERRWPHGTAAGPSSNGWPGVPERDSSGWQMTAHRGAAAGRPRDGEGLQALSEEMAAILREQATRHGIDIS